MLGRIRACRAGHARTTGNSERRDHAGGAIGREFGPPKAEMIADANLSVIGIPKARAESIRGFARAVADGRIRFDGAVSSEEMIGRMCELPRDRPVDRQLHRHAGAGRSGCISSVRSWIAEGCRINIAAEVGGGRRSLAAVALVRGDVSLGDFKEGISYVAGLR